MKIFILIFISFIPIFASSLDELESYMQTSPQDNNQFNKLEQILQKSQEKVDKTFFPWLKNQKNNSNQKQNFFYIQPKKQPQQLYKDGTILISKKDNNPLHTLIKVGPYSGFTSAAYTILYKTTSNDTTINLKDDLDLNLINYITGVKLDLSISKYNKIYLTYSTTLAKDSSQLKKNIVLNGKIFTDQSYIKSKFKYIEYDLLYAQDLDIFDAGLGYKSTKLQTTLEDDKKIETASSTISFVYLYLSLKMYIFNNQFTIFDKYSKLSNEEYNNVGFNIEFIHHKTNSLILGIDYEDYKYDYTHIKSDGNRLNFRISYLFGLNN